MRLWADIHCHLNLFDDAKGVVERAKAGNVSVILAVSETLEDSIKSVELAEGNEAVYAGVGLHPSRVSPETALQASKILELFAERKTAKLACVGEVGLDYKYAVTDTQKSLQQGVFEEFLAFAQEKKLLVNVHSRRAHAEVVSTVEKFDVKAHFHGFYAKPELLKRIAQQGHTASFMPGSLVYSDAAKKLKVLGAENVLLESDGPVEYGEGVGEPSWMPRLGERVAAALGMTAGEFEELHYAKARSLLGVK